MVKVVDENLVYLRKGKEISCKYSVKLDNGLDIDVKVPRAIANGPMNRIMTFARKRVSYEISKLERIEKKDRGNRGLKEEITVRTRYDQHRLEGKITEYRGSFITVQLDKPFNLSVATYVGDRLLEEDGHLTKAAGDIARRALKRAYDSVKLIQDDQR